MKIRRLKSKKGGISILGIEVSTMVLAVICIIFLLILIWKLSGILLSKTKMDQARETTKQIEAHSLALQDGETSEYIITGPSGWFLTFYDASKGNPIPESCEKKCLCICDWRSYTGDDAFRNLIYHEFADYNDCNEKGFCKEVSENYKIDYYGNFNKLNPDLGVKSRMYEGVAKYGEKLEETTNPQDYVYNSYYVSLYVDDDIVSLETVPKNIVFEKKGSTTYVYRQNVHSPYLDNLLEEATFSSTFDDVLEETFSFNFFAHNTAWKEGQIGKNDKELQRSYVVRSTGEYLENLVNKNSFPFGGAKIVYTLVSEKYNRFMNLAIVDGGKTSGNCQTISERFFYDKNNPNSETYFIVRFLVC